MVREKFLKITLNWKGISYLRTSIRYCGWMRLLCAKFWGPYSFPLGSSANFVSDVQQSYWSRHTNTVYIVREENSAAENPRTSRYKLGPIIFHFKTFLWQNVASKKFLKPLKVLMNLRANGARNCRRNEQFLSPLQHKSKSLPHTHDPHKKEQLHWYHPQQNIANTLPWQTGRHLCNP